uniref:WSC domain-containing protein n=3 Tax=Homalodisca liturata TaxID=320908 RepID=A0A1B6JFX4_9HEMI
MDFYKQLSFTLLTFSVFLFVSGTGDELRYVGCFDVAHSVLSKLHKYFYGLDLNKCVNYCAALNTRQAGIHKSENFCYCGDGIDENSERKDDTLCNISCGQDKPGANRTCGGENVMSLYDNFPTLKPTMVDNNISFLLGTAPEGVRLYRSPDLHKYDTLMSTDTFNDFSSDEVDYHYAKNLGFALADGKIYKSTLTPNSNANSTGPTVIKDDFPIASFAVDWFHDTIYWASRDHSNYSVKSVDLDGGNATTLLKIQTSGTVQCMEVDPYERKLFWIRDRVIETADLSGKNVQSSISDDSEFVLTMTLDLERQQIYYISYHSRMLSSLIITDYNGLKLQQPINIADSTPSFSIGLFGGQLFLCSNGATEYTLFKMNPGNFTEKMFVKAFRVVVQHMKLVHPDLQKPPKSNNLKEIK